MPLIRETTVQTIEYRVKTSLEDIEHAASNDGCRNPLTCMENVAGKRCLEEFLGAAVQHYRVDAGHIKFNYDGWRWVAITPKKAKLSLIEFDKLLNNKTVTTALLDSLKDKIGAHSYKVVAQRTTRIRPNTPERQQQVNAARRRRHAAGLMGPSRSNLKRRVIGLGAV